MTWVTVAEAVTLTGRSKSTIYDLTSRQVVRTIESSAGILIDLAQLRRVLAGRKRGRPRGTARPAM